VFPLRVEHGCNDSRPLVAARDRNKSNRSIYDTDYGALTILLAEKAVGKAAGAVLPGGSSLPAPLLLLEGGALGFDYGFCVEHHFRRGQSQGNIEVTGPPTLRFILDLLLRFGLSTPRNQYIASLWLAMYAAQKTATNRLSAPPQLAA
jgi:hypothetical protein